MRRFVSLLLASLVLALTACGGAPATVAPTIVPAADEPTVVAPTTVPATPTAEPAATAAPAETAPAAGTTGFPVTIENARNDVTLEGPAQRVVALEWTYVEDLLALGIQPVGVADIEGYNSWVKVPVALDPSVEDVGLRGEPNLEKIAALKPDLIIDVAFRADANYEQLNCADADLRAVPLRREPDAV
jgi:ferric hydroxamate transport system substrate-binding protein